MRCHWQILLWLILLGCLGCSRVENKKYQVSRPCMSTQVTITVFSDDAVKADNAINSAFQKISELESVLSRYKEGSDIERLNRAPHARVKIRPATFDLITRSVEFGRISQGAFDVTIGPVLKLWKNAEKINALPSPEDVNKAKELTGYSDIALSPDTQEAALSKDGMEIDLGGIAKGYIVGEAVKVLKSAGISQGLVSAGGDLYALGNNPERNAPWLVGLRNPWKPEDNLKYMKITDQAVATSGHYMRFYTVQGKRYSHIVDPRSGWPVEETIASVTVIASDGVTADALATIICVLGPDEGLKLAESLPGVETFIILNNPDKLSFLQSNGFSAFLEAE